MERMKHLIEQLGIWGIVVLSWLNTIQPLLNTIATLFAIAWTGIQIYNWYKKNGRK